MEKSSWNCISDTYMSDGTEPVSQRVYNTRQREWSSVMTLRSREKLKKNKIFKLKSPDSCSEDNGSLTAVSPVPSADRSFHCNSQSKKVPPEASSSELCACGSWCDQKFLVGIIAVINSTCFLKFYMFFEGMWGLSVELLVCIAIIHCKWRCLEDSDSS